MGISYSPNNRRQVFLKKVLTRKLTEKGPRGRSRHRCKYSVRKYFEEIGVIAINWIDSAQDRDN